MDAFEHVVGRLLEHHGYWVRGSFRIDLTKEEKRQIGRPSMPRPELDLVAYRGRDNEVLAVECKSYLDSYGIGIRAFDGSDSVSANRFKLFHDDNWRQIVQSALLRQLEADGMCAPGATVRWCLVAGKIKSAADREALLAHFQSKNWVLWDIEWLAARLEELARGSYQNDVVSMVAKLLERRHKRRVNRSKAQRRELAELEVPHVPGVATYKYSRVCFKADVIEPLRPHESFRIVTPGGSFQMTKAEFYRDFEAVTRTRSYREAGLYHYPQIPNTVERYRVRDDG